MRKLFVLIMLTSVYGCKSRVQLTKEFHQKFDKGEYDLAVKIVQPKIDKTKKKNKALTKSDLLWALHTGTAQKAAKQYDDSIETFDKVENLLKVFDKESILADSADQTGAILLNDNFMDYEGAEYDGVMVNTYKALIFLAKNDKDNARIELNRANNREKRAMKKYQAELAKLKKENNKKADVDKAMKTAAMKQIYSNMDSWKVYKDFVNPFTVYLTGLFRMLNNENRTAENYFKEAVVYSPNNSFISDDFNRLIKGRTSQNTAWVIFENGLGIRKEEKRIDIPINIPNAPVKYVGLAFPVLKETPAPFKYLIASNGKENIKTKLISSMDIVVKSEFKKEFTGIITRAIISLAIKTAAQVVAKKKQGDLGGLIAGGLAWMTTKADTRIWCSLPKEFQVAKIAIPKSRNIQIKTEYGKQFSVDIPKCNNAIIYIKMPTINAKPLMEVFKF